MQPGQQQEQAQLEAKDDAEHQGNGLGDEHWAQQEAQRLQEYAQAAEIGGDPDVGNMQEFEYEDGGSAHQPALTAQRLQQQETAMQVDKILIANGVGGPAEQLQGMRQSNHSAIDAAGDQEGEVGRGIPLDADTEPSKKRAAYTCDICGEAVAKYCCPGCSCRTCSLACSKKHKVERNCDGKRDKLAFVPLDQFDDRQLLSDYRLLEEVGRVGDVAHRCRPPAAKPQLPPHLANLVYQADRRRVKLMIMSPGMHRRRSNTTRYDVRTRRLSWRVEWVFQKAGQRVVDEQLAEDVILCEALSRHLKWQPGAAARQFPLAEYTDAGVGALKVFMRKERTPANAAVYYAIDINRPLGSQLAGKLVVEFPVLVVALPGEESQFPSAFINRRQQAPYQPSRDAAQSAHAQQQIQQASQVQVAPQMVQQEHRQVQQAEPVQGQGQHVGNGQEAPHKVTRAVKEVGVQNVTAQPRPVTAPHAAHQQQHRRASDAGHQQQHHQQQQQRTVQQGQQVRGGRQAPAPAQQPAQAHAHAHPEVPQQLQQQSGGAAARTGTVVGRVMQPMKLGDRQAPVQPAQHKPGGVMLPLKRSDVAPPAQASAHKSGGLMLPLKVGDVTAPALSAPHKPGSVMIPQRAGVAPTAPQQPPLHVTVPPGAAPHVRPGVPTHALPSPTTPTAYPQGPPPGAPAGAPTGPPPPHYPPHAPQALPHHTAPRPTALPPAAGPPHPHYYPPQHPSQPPQHPSHPTQPHHHPPPAQQQAPYSHVRPHLQPGAPPPGPAPHHPPPGPAPHHPPSGPATHHPHPGAYPGARPPGLQHTLPPHGSQPPPSSYMPRPNQALHAHRPPGLAVPHAGAPPQQQHTYGQQHSPYSQLPSPHAQHPAGPGPPHGVHMQPPPQQPHQAAWPPSGGPYHGGAPYGAHARSSAGGAQMDANEIPL